MANFFDAEIRPTDHSILQKFVSLHLPHDPQQLRDLYESESSPCAAWVFPYRAFDFRAVGLSRKNRVHQTIAFENKRFNDGIPGKRLQNRDWQRNNWFEINESVSLFLFRKIKNQNF